MAVEIPTIDEFMARFPSFEGQDELIEILLIEAARAVDDSWETEDQKIAILYYTAHLAATEPVNGMTASTPAIASESIRGMSTSYFTGGKMTGLESTEYGRRFLALLKKNVADGIVVVGGVGLA